MVLRPNRLRSIQMKRGKAAGIFCAPAHIIHVGKFHPDLAERPHFKKVNRPKNSRQKGSLEINKIAALPQLHQSYAKNFTRRNIDHDSFSRNSNLVTSSH